MNYAELKKETIDLTDYTKDDVGAMVDTNKLFTINKAVYHEYTDSDGKEQSYFTCLDTENKRFFNSFTALFYFLKRVEEQADKEGKTLNEQLASEALPLTFIRKKSTKNGKLMFDFNIVDRQSNMPF